MGIRILSGDAGACFYCSVTDWCFGPLMGSYEEADLFESYLSKIIGVDARILKDSQMETHYSVFRRKFCCSFCGDFIEENFKCYRLDDDIFCDNCDWIKENKEKNKLCVEVERQGLGFFTYGKADE